MSRTPLAQILAVAAAAVAIAVPAAQAASVTKLPFAGAFDLAVDGAHEHVFVSGGAGTSSLLVLDFDGKIVKTIAGQNGASGLVLDEASGTLYVALRDATAISKIDTATLTETSRFSVAPLSLPTYLALAGGRLWFAHSCSVSGRGGASVNLDGTGVLDLVAFRSDCPTFATSSGNPNLLAAAAVGTSPTTLELFDASTSTPTLLRSVRGPGGAGNLRDLAATPDGLRVLSASGAPYQVQSFLTSDLSLAATYPTGPYPVAVTVSDDGAYVAAGARSSTSKDVFVFPAGDTTPLRSWDFNSTRLELISGGLAFGPDAGRLFAVTAHDDGWAEFRVYGNPTGPVVATATSLTASTTTVRHGKSVTLRARVSGATGGTVALYATPYGRSKALVKTATVNGAGVASFVVKPAARTVYTAEFPETDTHAASASSARTILVRPRAKVKLTGFRGRSGKFRLYRLGRNPGVRGAVVPKHPGVRLRFVAQRYQAGVWRTAATGTFTTGSSGWASAVLRNASVGRYRQRVVFSGDPDHVSASSPWVYLEIRR